MWKVDELTPEEAHAAEDLALYTVNTRDLYQRAQRIMLGLVSIRKAHGRDAKTVATGVGDDRIAPMWIGHAKDGYQSYQRELGYDGNTVIQVGKQYVLRDAARRIAEHYAEEMEEMA